MEFCTDNGAMIALAGALHLQQGQGPGIEDQARSGHGFTVRPRWDLATVASAAFARR
jgi:N6-L-threonylcarbamoyladenine synthase